MVSQPGDESGDMHSPRQEMDRMDQIVLSALGEPVEPAFSAHLAGCPKCQVELDALARTADLAREGHDSDSSDLSPSSAVWDSIAAELGLEDTRVDPLGGWSHRARTWSLAAAAAVLAVVACGLGYVVGQAADPEAGQGSVAASARLAPMPGGPAGVEGTATLLDTSEGTQLSVSASGLPSRSGYYEVWLFNPDLNQMVAVGTLATNDTGTFPVPAGLDPSAYRVVDVSAQDFDGNPVHQRSVLRGQLSP